MIWAPVPETAVYKNCNFLRCENDIRRAWKIIAVNPETQSLGIKCLTQKHLWLRVFTAYAAHIEPSLLSGENIRHKTLGPKPKKVIVG